MARSVYLLIIGLVTLVFAGGCSKSATGNAESNFIKEFQSADAALKSKADFAVTAYKATNYVGVVTTLQEIGANPTLTPQQQKAVQDLRELVSTEMYDKIDKGDANAIQARDVLQGIRRRPRQGN